MTSDELSRLLAAERAARSPSGASDAGLQRLLTALAAQAAPLPIAAGALKVGWSVFSKWLALGFVVGVAGAGASVQAWPREVVAPAAQPTPASLGSVAPLGSGASVPSPVVISGSASSSSPGPSAPASALRIAELARVTSAAPHTPSAPAVLDQELRLLALAKKELDMGRPHLALAWLEEHRQRFPSGALGLERDALSILGRCDQRRQPGLAREFALQHPSSPMLAQLSRRCAAVSADSSAPVNAAGGLREPTDE